MLDLAARTSGVQLYAHALTLGGIVALIDGYQGSLA
jgi:hypothetical protein